MQLATFRTTTETGVEYSVLIRKKAVAVQFAFKGALQSVSLIISGMT
jgi:hypothetical protein